MFAPPPPPRRNRQTFSSINKVSFSWWVVTGDHPLGVWGFIPRVPVFGSRACVHWQMSPPSRQVKRAFHLPRRATCGSVRNGYINCRYADRTRIRNICEYRVWVYNIRRWICIYREYIYTYLSNIFWVFTWATPTPFPEEVRKGPRLHMLQAHMCHVICKLCKKGVGNISRCFFSFVSSTKPQQYALTSSILILPILNMYHKNAYIYILCNS